MRRDSRDIGDSADIRNVSDVNAISDITNIEDITDIGDIRDVRGTSSMGDIRDMRKVHKICVLFFACLFLLGLTPPTYTKTTANRKGVNTNELSILPTVYDP